ncbi:MAG: methionyl-tRNA formyltransferase, partial [Lachnospiraceae bacterium]|nr:methionyl-tRNA formyltransferase [Lachnospiraceae bacterium]
MRLIFMGTPDFAVPTLDALVRSEHEVAAVYTQQDKPQGRSGKPVPSPVKVYAEAAGIPVLQPASFRKAEVLEEMRGFSADAIIVVAFSRILKKRVLEMTPYGCFNVHASLLPRYRGAAPVQWAILEGEQETGVTIMQMDEGLDTGDILNQVTIPIEPDETGDSLFEKLSRLGGPLLLETLKEAEAGDLHPVKQGESPTVYAAMLDKSMGRIDFSRDAVVIERYIRGLYSWPSAYTDRDGKILKIYKAEVVEKEAEGPAEVPAAGEAGETDGGTCACNAEQPEAMECPACASGTEQSEAMEC